MSAMPDSTLADSERLIADLQLRLALVRQRYPFRQSRDGSPLGRILAGEPIVHVANTLSDGSYQTSSGFREMVEASGVCSGIMVALRKEDALLGTITVYRREVRPFLGQADRAIAEFRRTSGRRNGNCACSDRDA